MINYEKLVQISQDEGLEIFAVLSLDSAGLELSRQREYLQQWQDMGYAAGMEYMKRDVEIFTSLERLLPEVKSVLVFSAAYSSCAPAETPEGYARVARYAWGRDYHRVLKRKIKRVANRVQELISEDLQWRGFTDAVPLLERPLAALGNLGFIGRHSLLIHPHRGSFSFLAELLLDQELTNVPTPKLPGLNDDSYDPKIPGAGCGRCRSCIPACPTQAITSDGVINSQLCISYLSIEHKGCFSAEEAKHLGEWIFGCDVCQEVCPFNLVAERSELSEFSPEQGCGPHLSLKEVISIRSRDEFLQRFAGTSLMRAGREGLIRNACAVTANLKWHEGIEPLISASTLDPSDIVRKSAFDALRVLRAEAEGLNRLRIDNAIRRDSEIP